MQTVHDNKNIFHRRHRHHQYIRRSIISYMHSISSCINSIGLFINSISSFIHSIGLFIYSSSSFMHSID